MAFFFSFLLLAQAKLPQEVVLRARGIWILSESGEPVKPALWMRGLQTSGLTARSSFLVSVGDQRSNFPGHLFVLPFPGKAQEKSRSTRLLYPPVPIVPRKRVKEILQKHFRLKDNPDFEGIAADPLHPETYYGVIEMDGPYIVEISWKKGAGKAFMERIAEVELPNLSPWRYDTNYRFEGVSVIGPAPTLVVAFERAEDGLPRLIKFDWPRKSSPERIPEKITAKILPVNFDDIPPREGKGLLNANALAAVFGRTCERSSFPELLKLLVLARDQERILVVEPSNWKVSRIFSIDFRGPKGERIKWVSPEGIAVEEKSGTVYVVSDPDSIRGNFRKLSDREPKGRYAELVPLLFSLKLKDILK